MGDDRIMRARIYPGLFVLGSMAILAFSLLPVGVGTARFLAPDFLVCFMVSWVLRRPDYAPALLIAAVFFLSDILTGRPLGLWTAIAVLGSEFLRKRVLQVLEMSFLGEWLFASVFIFASMLSYRLVLAVSFSDLPPLGEQLLHYVATVFAYPAAAVVTNYVFKVRRVDPGEIDTLKGQP